ncbi:hypothetical protein DSO57_1013012 [Entomophthora muscae]|uniref:Uncharacterized protein n=1 Tax=Entomophthora muscae TaxID=34485 RepID=A0ACC2USX0_9FUNG|nr:hypothetical protein DSO57_1013012 [Entomophthora muscae]
MDEDEIIQEVDVFLASHLIEHLYLFQFPVREKGSSENPCLPDARIKPNACIIELDVPISTDQTTYNVTRGSELGAEADQDPKPSGDRGYNSGSTKLYDKQTSTSEVLPLHTNYFVGAMKEGQLHLSKVKDTKHQREIAAKKRLEKANTKPTESGPKILQRQLATSNLTAFEEAKQKVLDKRNANVNESWKPLKYYAADSEMAEAAYKHLFCKDMDVELTSKENGLEYLDLISSTDPSTT